MKLREFILYTAGIASAGATVGCTCPNSVDEASGQYELTARNLLRALETQAELAGRYGVDAGMADLETIQCLELCREAVNGGDISWSPTAELTSCSFELTVDTLPTMETGDPVGMVECYGEFTHCRGGRRPRGHFVLASTGAGLGAYFAGCAEMEAISVIAFVELAENLGRLGAPQKLVDRCLAAARDEVVHARLLAGLAAVDEAVVTPVRHRVAEPDLFATALHNAVEGCINESWAALVVHWQSLHAPSPGMRALYGRIAEDEMRHGQLSWDLHHWFMGQLSAEQRNEIEGAQQTAVLDLVATVATEMPPEGVGLPSPTEAVGLARSFGNELAA